MLVATTLRLLAPAGRWRQRLLPVLLAVASALCVPAVAGDGASRADEPVAAARPARLPRLDHPGRKQVGMASYYARRFAGRRMADGTPMRPESDNAASRTLPLGTTARVTNLHNGRSATVTIRDRGPHGRGRIIDVSPSTARQLGMMRAGVVRVEVTPLTLPPSRRSPGTVVALADREP